MILNFEDLDALAANKLLAFFAGACYALEGRNVKINEKTYLFARKVDFLTVRCKRLSIIFQEGNHTAKERSENKDCSFFVCKISFKFVRFFKKVGQSVPKSNEPLEIGKYFK